MSTAYCSIKLQGKGIIREKEYPVIMSTVSKKEQDYYMNSLDSAETIDYSDVENIRLIIFYSDYPFSLKFTKDTNEITIPVQDVFVLAPNAMTGFDSIELASLNETDHLIEVKFYGENS